MPQGTAVLVHLIQCQFHYQIASFVAAAHRLEAQLLHQLVHLGGAHQLADSSADAADDLGRGDEDSRFPRQGTAEIRLDLVRFQIRCPEILVAAVHLRHLTAAQPVAETAFPERVSLGIHPPVVHGVRIRIINGGDLHGKPAAVA